MEDVESPNTPYTTLRTRFHKGTCIVDHFDVYYKIIDFNIMHSGRRYRSVHLLKEPTYLIITYFIQIVMDQEIFMSFPKRNCCYANELETC